MKGRNIYFYKTPNGKEPVLEWLNSIKNKSWQQRIESRISYICFGNFGDYKNVGNGVFELRFFFGPGYRLYFGILNESNLIVLLAGGNKSSQRQDIMKARRYLNEFKNRS